MDETLKPDKTIVVIFGAAGDLTRRKLVPGFYNLFLDRTMPDDFVLLGVDKQEMSDDKFASRLHDGVSRFSRRGAPQDSTWQQFAEHVHYMQGDFGSDKCFQDVASWVSDKENEWQKKVSRIFYFAVPPSFIGPLSTGLDDAGLTRDREHSRVVVEKPFGHDLESARHLNKLLGERFKERQIYRIDHYLGKETVQNLMAFRFANALFEPVWEQHYIDHIQITVAEDAGVGHRGGYYEGAGALRDMIQNHMMQLLCLIAMEPPVSFDDNEIRNKKVDVLHAVRPIPEEDIQDYAVRGQYDEGWLEGKKVSAYQEESGVSKESSTETYAAVKLFVDNWRWQGVPFYLRTGKRLASRVSEISIQFLPVPHRSFPSSASLDWVPNRLVLRIQPDEGIVLQFQAKQPGPRMRLTPVSMNFCYDDSFEFEPPEAYETLLLDVMLGDATLFMRADQVEAAWSVIMPIIKVWSHARPLNFPNYQAGTWGPEEGEVLIARDGRSWAKPLTGGCS